MSKEKILNRIYLIFEEQSSRLLFYFPLIAWMPNVPPGRWEVCDSKHTMWCFFSEHHPPATTEAHFSDGNIDSWSCITLIIHSLKFQGFRFNSQNPVSGNWIDFIIRWEFFLVNSMSDLASWSFNRSSKREWRFKETKLQSRKGCEPQQYKSWLPEHFPPSPSYPWPLKNTAHRASLSAVKHNSAHQLPR